MSLSKDKIIALYIAVYGRAPDKEGMDYWQQADTYAVAAAGFVSHVLFAQEYGNSTNREMVEKFYLNIFGSKGDTEGIDFWTASLDDGVEINQVLADFLTVSLTTDFTHNSVALSRQKILENKIKISNFYLEKLGGNFNLDGIDPDSLDVINAPDFKFARKVIEDITSDPVTVTQAENLINTVVDQSDKSGGNPVVPPTTKPDQPKPDHPAPVDPPKPDHVNPDPVDPSNPDEPNIPDDPIKPLIIDEDTVWASGKVVDLNREIQISPDVTLTIESGAVINGNGHSITAYGTLDVQGVIQDQVNFNDVNLNFGQQHDLSGQINLNYVQMTEGAFLPRSGYGAFTVENSTFSEVSGFYIWYPTAPSSFRKNIFKDSNGLELLLSNEGTLEIKNNVFVDQKDSAIKLMANYNDGLLVTENSFLSTDKIALEVTGGGHTGGPFPAYNNYFGTTDIELIEHMILDRHDSLDRSTYVEHAPVLNAPSLNTPVFDYEEFSQETLLSWFNEHLNNYEGKVENSLEARQEDLIKTVGVMSFLGEDGISDWLFL